MTVVENVPAWWSRPMYVVPGASRTRMTKYVSSSGSRSIRDRASRRRLGRSATTTRDRDGARARRGTPLHSRTSQPPCSHRVEADDLLGMLRRFADAGGTVFCRRAQLPKRLPSRTTSRSFVAVGTMLARPVSAVDSVGLAQAMIGGAPPIETRHERRAPGASVVVDSRTRRARRRGVLRAKDIQSRRPSWRDHRNCGRRRVPVTRTVALFRRPARAWSTGSIEQSGRRRIPFLKIAQPATHSFSISTSLRI